MELLRQIDSCSPCNESQRRRTLRVDALPAVLNAAPLLLMQDTFKSRLGIDHKFQCLDADGPLQAPHLHLKDMHKILTEAFGNEENMARISTLDGRLDWARLVLQAQINQDVYIPNCGSQFAY